MDIKNLNKGNLMNNNRTAEEMEDPTPKSSLGDHVTSTNSSKRNMIAVEKIIHEDIEDPSDDVEGNKVYENKQGPSDKPISYEEKRKQLRYGNFTTMI